MLLKKCLFPIRRLTTSCIQRADSVISIAAASLKQIPNMIKCGFDSDGQPMNTQPRPTALRRQNFIGVIPTNYDENASEEEQRQWQGIADKFCRPDKPSILNGRTYHRLSGRNFAVRINYIRVLYGQYI